MGSSPKGNGQKICKVGHGMYSVDEMKKFLEDNGCDFELIQHDMSIVSVVDAAKYFDVNNAAPVFIIDTEKGLIAIIFNAERGRLNFKDIKQNLMFPKFKFADKKDVERATGYQVGAIPLIGCNLPCVFDKSLLAKEYIYGGTGDKLFTLKIKPHDVYRLNNVIYYLN